jgi:hypothetical protein
MTENVSWLAIGAGCSIVSILIGVIALWLMNKKGKDCNE